MGYEKFFRAIRQPAGAIPTAQIADDAVTNAKLANISRGYVKVGGTSNAPTDLNAKTSGYILVGDGTDVNSVAVSGDVTLSSAGAVTIANSAVTTAKLGLPKVNVLTETHAASTFTDGGSTSGTKAFTGTIPVGAIVLHTKVTPTAGFAGDTTAALKIGDGSDDDRYNTSTANIFATAANGVDAGNPSGVRYHAAAATPTLTVTSSTDFTPVLAGGGSVTVSIYYIQTV